MAEEILVPKKLPDEGHAVVVTLESSQIPMPEIDTSPLTHETLVYRYTNAKDDIAARIKDASIVVTTICPLRADTIRKAPYL